MGEQTLFVATPLHTQSLHLAWVRGALSAHAAFSGRIKIQTQVGSVLPRNRDILTAQFIESPATHMLCVDSDIGWTAEQAQKLLDTGKDFISGVYCKKQADRGIPAELTGKEEGELAACEYVPGGFLLLSRAVIERMIGAYREMEYIAKPYGRIWALWAPLFVQGVTYSGEDVAFCSRWRKIGGEIWMHRGVVLSHYGDMAYRPDDVAANIEEPAAKSAEAPAPVSPSNGHSPTLKLAGRLPYFVHPDPS